jgi:hypothetical protein
MIRETFKNLSRVELKDVKKVYFSSDELGEKKVETTSDVDILTKSDKEENSFIVHLNGLNNPGIYYLQMPEGTFDYSNSGKLVTDVKLAAKFSLTEPEPQFNATYDLYSVLQVIERNSHAIDIISDVDLNDLVIMAQVPRFYNALVPNPNAVVEIVNAYNVANVVGRGHFEEYPTFAEDYPQYYADGYTTAIKLVMDEPVAAGALQNNTEIYSYHIPEAAFGDANYKLYLENPDAISNEFSELFEVIKAELESQNYNILNSYISEDEIRVYVQTPNGLEELIINDSLFVNPLYIEAVHIYSKMKERDIDLPGDPLEVLENIEKSAKKGAYIQRYKGLGEMNPEQLWETTMNPENRRLLKIDVKDMQSASDVFELFMGDEVEPRREYIQSHAKDVKHLDV